MSFAQSLQKNHKIYAAVFVLSVVAVLIHGIFSQRVYSGQMVLNLVDLEPIFEISRPTTTELESNPLSAADLAFAFAESFSMKDLEEGSSGPSLLTFGFNPIRKSDVQFGIVLTGTDKTKLADAFERLPQVLNRVPLLVKKAEEARAVLRSEQAGLDEALLLSNKVKMHLENAVAQNKISQIAFDPISTLQEVLSLERQRTILGQTLARVEGGLIQPFARARIESKPIRPRILLNFIFWPCLALFVTAFVLASCCPKKD